MFYSKRQVSDLPYITLPGGICRFFLRSGIRRNHGEPWFCPATSEGGHARRKTCPPLSARLYLMVRREDPPFRNILSPALPSPFAGAGAFLAAGDRACFLALPDQAKEGELFAAAPFGRHHPGIMRKFRPFPYHAGFPLLRPGQSAPEVPPCSFRHRGQR